MMSEPGSSSWAQVLINGSAEAPFDSRRLEFRWKTVKKGRLRPSASSPTDECLADHCQTSTDHCIKNECLARLKRQLSILQAENNALAAAFAERLRDLDKLRVDISENCKMDDFFSIENEQSRVAVVKARRAKATPLSCECVNCQLAFQQNESVIVNEKLSAAQHRLKVLREYRVANDKGAVQRTTSHFNQSAKYFTAVGTAKGKGVSALRPTLQMQSSYDVAALTTNSMIARPLKIAWKDKPKPLRILQSKAT